jgi:hypothetical protein
MNSNPLAIKDHLYGRHGYFILIMIVLCMACFVYEASNYFEINDQVNTTNKASQEHVARKADAKKKKDTASNTGWPLNPFNKGKIVTGSQSNMPVFRTPLLTWQTKTIRGIKYTFGAGNPAEVTPKREDYEDDFDYSHDNVVTVETEKNLLAFLSNPTLENVLNKCGMLIKPDVFDQNSTVVQSFPRSLYESDFSLEKMLYVDFERRGQKKIDFNRMWALGTALGQLNSIGSFEEKPLVSKCLTERETANFSALLDQYFKLVQSYMN